MVNNCWGDLKGWKWGGPARAEGTRREEMIDAGRVDSKYKDLSVTVEHGEIGYDDGDGQRNG